MFKILKVDDTLDLIFPFSFYFLVSFLPSVLYILCENYL